MKISAAAIQKTVDNPEFLQIDVNLDRVVSSLNTRHWKWTLREEVECNQSLLEFLTDKLPHIDSLTWPERSDWGGIHVNGKPASLTMGKLPCPCWIEYYEPKLSVAEARAELTTFDPEQHIVYEDDSLAVVFKPASLHSNPPREQQQINLRHSLDKYYGSAIHLPSRLDFSTAGLLIISRHASAHRAVQYLYQKRQVEKFYLCKGQGIPRWKYLELSAAIDDDPRHRVLRQLVASGGKEALTGFTALKFYPEESATLFCAKPFTGRTHQIRLHAAGLGHNLYGDDFYCGPPAESLHLLCYRLLFPHPQHGGTLDIRVPDNLLPSWLPRQNYADLLRETLPSR